MSILVRKIDNVWQEWYGNLVVAQMHNTYTAVYGDGRNIETPCEPYPVDVQINGDAVRGFYDMGIWTPEEIEAVGGKIAVPFEAPEGKQTVGSPEYDEQPDGSIEQVYSVEDIPPPPDPPTASEKLEAMLSAYGLTLGEMMTVLGLDD